MNSFVLSLLESFGDHSACYLSLNSGTEYFNYPGIEGVVAFQTRGNYLFQYGDVISPPASKSALFGKFLEFARGHRKKVCVVQIKRSDVPRYLNEGFTVNQLGCSFTLDITDYSLQGAKFLKLRNRIKRAESLGVGVAELGVDLPRDNAMFDRLEEISAAWLKEKKKKQNSFSFLVGEIDRRSDTPQRIFVARLDGQIVGFISYVPSFGCLPGMLHDLSRRDVSAPPGTMEQINYYAIRKFQEDGTRHLHFGITPCAGINHYRDNCRQKSLMLAGTIKGIAKFGKALYPSANQAQYKMKWQPGIISPEYLAFQGSFSPSMVWSFFQLTNVVNLPGKPLPFSPGGRL